MDRNFSNREELESILWLEEEEKEEMRIARQEEEKEGCREREMERGKRK